MPDTAVETPKTETPKPFDAAEYIKTANEREQAARSGKPAETKPAEPAAPAPKPAESEPADKTSSYPRAARREINKLREEAAEARGRLKAYEELHGKPKDGETPPAAAPAAAVPDPEPQRKDFAQGAEGDAAYQRALGYWSGSEGAKKKLAEAEALAAFERELNEVNSHAAEDSKRFDDWTEVAKRALNPDVVIQFNAAEEPDWEEESEGGTKTVGVTADFQAHPLFATLLAKSAQKAAVSYHLALHPEILWNLLSLEKKPNSLIANFHQLEGEVKVVYKEKGKAAPGAAPAKATPKPEKLPRPSEAVSVRGGSTPHGKISPVLEDGKTVNPAWLAQRNDREGARR